MTVMKRALAVHLERRLLLALGLTAGAYGCRGQPDASLADGPQAAATGGHAPHAAATAEPAATASPFDAAPTPAASLAPEPPASASATTALSAVASASASAPVATTPIPPEPGCQGHCTTQQTCVKPPEKPPAKPMAAPFDRCAPYTGMGTFSASRTKLKRAAEPDVCCYLQVRVMPVKGRPLLGPHGPIVAALRAASGWMAGWMG